MTVFCFWIPLQKSLHTVDWILSLYLSGLLFLSFLFISAGSKYPTRLQEAEISIIEHLACEKIYNPVGILLPQTKWVIQESMICAADPAKKKDTCQVRVCSWIFFFNLTWDLNWIQVFPSVNISELGIRRQMFWQ